jgi:hypothetical protein
MAWFANGLKDFANGLKIFANGLICKRLENFYKRLDLQTA